MRSLLLMLPVLCAAFATGEENSSISATDLESHVRFLASDALQGRKTGSSDALLAAGYIASVLDRAGVEGAGDDGSFLQAVALHRLVAHDTPRLELQVTEDAPLELVHGVHFSIYRNPASKTGALRVVTVLEGAPLPEPDESIALELEGSKRDVRRLLEEAGRADGRGYGMILLRGAKSDGKPRGPVRGGRLRRGEPDASAAPPWLVSRGELRKALQAGRVQTIEFDGACELARVEASNVVARIPGVGTPDRPELANEVVVISAHYDHLGTIPEGRKAPLDESGAEDRIYNGADDDVSGVACVLELARVLAAGSPPARELVFFLATGEEQGLLGTEYYLDHHAELLERTICNLNVEMIGRADTLIGGAGQVWFTGPDETNLFEAFNAAGVPVSRDPYPEENYYQRSDNYAFVRRGVIGQSFSTFNGHPDYHKVTDEADTLDFDHMAAATRITLDAVRLVADGSIDPSWAEGKGPPPPR